MPEDPEYQDDQEVEEGDWDVSEDTPPDKLTFDDLWNVPADGEGEAESEGDPEGDPEGEGDEVEEGEPVEPEPAPSTKVKIGREEIEVGDGPGQWSEDQVNLLERYKKEADQQKSTAQSMEALVDRLTRESAKVSERVQALESGGQPASSAPVKSAGDFMARIAKMDESLGAEGVVSGIIGELHEEIQSLKGQAQQFEGVAKTTREIEYEKMMDRESAGLYRDLSDAGVDPNDTETSFDDAPDGTTPYSHGLAWMMAYQRNLREQGMEDNEIYSPAWMTAARYFGVMKASTDYSRTSLANKGEPVKATPQRPNVPWQRQRTTPSVKMGPRSPAQNAPDVLSDEDRALIPM